MTKRIWSALTIVAVVAIAVGFAGGWIAHKQPATTTPSMRSPQPSSPAASTLSGTLAATGGPLPKSGVPLAGTVCVTLARSLGPPACYVSVGRDGNWSVEVKPGLYAVWGSSPMFNKGKKTCAPKDNVVRVAADTHPIVNVVCLLEGWP